jgi:hypothetical protein
MGKETVNQDREALIERAVQFLDEVKDMTAGTETERWLNRKYGPDSELYQTFARLVRKGVEDGWAANVELDGPVYRRSRIAEPSERTRHFSITAVYMDSSGNHQGIPATPIAASTTRTLTGSSTWWFRSTRAPR